MPRCATLHFIRRGYRGYDGAPFRAWNGRSSRFGYRHGCGHDGYDSYNALSIGFSERHDGYEGCHSRHGYNGFISHYLS